MGNEKTVYKLATNRSLMGDIASSHPSEWKRLLLEATHEMNDSGKKVVKKVIKAANPPVDKIQSSPVGGKTSTWEQNCKRMKDRLNQRF